MRPDSIFTSLLLFVAAALWTATPSCGAAIQSQEIPKRYDVIIIGGGPAGLAACSGLARVRRKVLLIDSGEYRSSSAHHIHDVLGFDGMKQHIYREISKIHTYQS